MTIKELVYSLSGDASTALDGYSIIQGTKQYWESVERYLPDKIMVIEPPKTWPLNYFLNCQTPITLTVFIGWRIAINDDMQMQDVRNYLFDDMLSDVKLFMAQVDENPSYFVTEDTNAELYDPTQGETRNNYAYVKFDLKIKFNG